MNKATRAIVAAALTILIAFCIAFGLLFMASDEKCPPGKTAVLGENRWVCVSQ